MQKNCVLFIKNILAESNFIISIRTEKRLLTDCQEPVSYTHLHGEGVNKNKTFKDVYGWGSSTICNILEKREYCLLYTSRRERRAQIRSGRSQRLHFYRHLCCIYCMKLHRKNRTSRWLWKCLEAHLSLIHILILDPFAGAGTTVLAAVVTGYRAVGSEVTDAYYKLGSDRVKIALEAEMCIRDRNRGISR